MIDLLTSRIRARIESGAAVRQRGFITMQVLAITVLLLVAAGGLVGVAQATIHTSREARDFTDARRSADMKENDLLIEFRNPATPPMTFNGSADVGRSGSGGSGRMSWEWAANASNRTVTIRSTLDGTGPNATPTVEESVLPVRGTLVVSRDSVTSANGGVSYGIPAGPRPATTPQSSFAMGLWGNSVSTSAGTSIVNGAVGATTHLGVRYGTWATFGGTITGAGNAEVVAFADGISSPPNAGSFNRSRLNAFMDTRVSDQLMSNVRSNADCASYRNIYYFTALNATLTGDSGYGCWKGDLTYPAITATPSGVITHVVKGDLTLAGNINTNAGELHIYVDGDVTFGNAATPGTRHYNHVYIHAPNGTCRAAAGTIVNMNGSLACKTVVLDQPGANWVGWKRPREQSGLQPYTLSARDPAGNYRNVDSPQVIHYFERPGFIDQWSS